VLSAYAISSLKMENNLFSSNLHPNLSPIDCLICNSLVKERKPLVYIDHQNVNSLCSCHHNLQQLALVLCIY